MKNLFLACADLLENGEETVMVSILSDERFAPKPAGNRMIVRQNGSIIGTIGGGIFETLAIRKAEDVFQSRESMIEAFKFSGKDANRS